MKSFYLYFGFVHLLFILCVKYLMCGVLSSELIHFFIGDVTEIDMILFIFGILSDYWFMVPPFLTRIYFNLSMDM